MAYTVAWNEATPVGAATLASDIDLEIRNLKVSISERMSQLVDWDTDATDPKRLLAAALPEGGSWDTNGTDLEIADGLGWGGGRIIPSSDDIHELNLVDINGWYAPDVSANQIEAMPYFVFDETSIATDSWYGFIALRAGTVVGLYAILNAARTAGILTVGIRKNSDFPATIQVTFDGTGSNLIKYTSVAKDAGIDFVAGDGIGTYYTTDPNFLPVTADMRIGIQVAYDA